MNLGKTDKNRLAPTPTPFVIGTSASVFNTGCVYTSTDPADG